MPTLYRIIRDKYRHEPLSVAGSRLFGGRWNPKGTSVLYTTSTPELGLVETLAHAPAVRYEELPIYWVFSLAVPDDIRHYKREELPAYWQDETYESTQNWLKDWLAMPDQLGVAPVCAGTPIQQRYPASCPRAVCANSHPRSGNSARRSTALAVARLSFERWWLNHDRRSEKAGVTTSLGQNAV